MKCENCHLAIEYLVEIWKIPYDMGFVTKYMLYLFNLCYIAEILPTRRKILLSVEFLFRYRWFNESADCVDQLDVLR